MFSLSWDIEELNKIATEGRKIRIELSTTLSIVSSADDGFQQQNVPRKIKSIRDRLGAFVKETIRFKRKAATHIFVIMISSELRDHKPYALPVQCLPYTGLDEANLRRLVNSLIVEMVSHGMKVSGEICTEYYHHGYQLFTK